MRARTAKLIWCSSSLLPLTLGTALLGAQDKPMPASPTPPPEVQSLERIAAPPAPAPAPTTDQLLQRLGITRTDIDRRKAAGVPADAIRPAGTEPPDVQAQRSSQQPPPAPRTPTIAELIDIIRHRPGGQDVLDRAARAGARIPQAVGGGDFGLELTTHRPFQGESTFDSNDDGRAMQSTADTLTRNAPSASVTGVGTAQAWDTWPSQSSTGPYWGPLLPANAAVSGMLPAYNVVPGLRFRFSPQITGYYLVNVQAVGPNAFSYAPSAQLLTWTGAGWGPVPGGQWNPTTNWASYPVLIYLSGGVAYDFLWNPTTQNRKCMVSQLSITKM
ncbi:MAG: hypothetical protein ACM3SX_10480 [Deltaproteobacteria bacterium]